MDFYGFNRAKAIANCGSLELGLARDTNNVRAWNRLRPEHIVELLETAVPAARQDARIVAGQISRGSWRIHMDAPVVGKPQLVSNVRELQNAAERFALGLDLDLDVELQGESSPTLQELAGNLSAQVEAFERSLICAELNRSHSSLRSLAEALGVPRKTLHDKLRKHGLSFAETGGSSPEHSR